MTTPWTDLEVEIFGTAGSFANPKPYMSIRETLAQEVHNREQAVRGEATARAIADSDMMDRVVSIISKNRVEIEAAAKEIALSAAQKIVKDAQDKTERIVADTERRCMAALDARLQQESQERKDAAKKVDQSSFLRSALIMLFFSLCFAGMLYIQDSSGSQKTMVDVAPSPPVKDIAMQHAVSAHDVRLVKIESDRQAFIQRLNRVEVELAEAQGILKQNDHDIKDLAHARSDAVQSALSVALEGHKTQLDEREDAQRSLLQRTEVDLQAVKDQLAKIQFVIPSFESHVSQLETDFRKQLSLVSRMDTYENGINLHEQRMVKYESDLSRGEHMKAAFRVGSNQYAIAADHIICMNGYMLLGQRCLMISDARKTFPAAREHCQLTGGDLAVMRSDDDWEIFKVLITGNTHSWVGLNKSHGGGKWEWLNGRGGERGDSDGYQKWGPKQPDGSGRCGSVYPIKADIDNPSGVQFTMEATDCSLTQYFLCEYAGSIGFEKVTQNSRLGK